MKRGIFAILLLCLDLFGEENDDRLILNFFGEPTVEEVQREALKHSYIKTKELSSIVARARYKELLPELEIKGYYGQGKNESLDIKEINSAKYGIDTDEDLSFSIGIRFRLNRIIYNNDELRVRYHLLDLTQEEKHLLSFVTELYFKRRRLQLIYYYSSPKDRDERIKLEIEFLKLTSILDAITGYRFKNRWKRTLIIER